jgi:hypothetical protein
MIFELVRADDGSGICRDYGRALHAAVAIAIGKNNKHPSIGTRNEDLCAVPCRSREKDSGQSEHANDRAAEGDWAGRADWHVMFYDRKKPLGRAKKAGAGRVAG